jgi:hypothetical protein
VTKLNNESTSPPQSAIVVSPSAVVWDAVRAALPDGATITWLDDLSALASHRPRPNADLLVLEEESFGFARLALRILSKKWAFQRIIVICDAPSILGVFAVLDEGAHGWVQRSDLRADVLTSQVEGVFTIRGCFLLDPGFRSLPMGFPPDHEG